MFSLRFMRKNAALLLGGGVLAWWLLSRGWNVARAAGHRLGRQAVALWQKLPIPANNLPGIGYPLQHAWSDSDLSQAWNVSWFDSWRVLTIGDSGDLDPLHGYLEFKNTHLVESGDQLGGIYGDPVPLAYLGEAISRLSAVEAPVEFSLLPEDVVLHPVLSHLAFVDPGSGIPGIRRSYFALKHVRLGQAFCFRDPSFAHRVITRLADFCEVKWLTASGWHWAHPLRDKARSQYTLPFLGGTLVIISADPRWAAVMAGGEVRDDLRLDMGLKEDGQLGNTDGFIPDTVPDEYTMGGLD